ncbi:MAG: ABC transporter ATP-binding protein [Lentisphaeria bacterium]|nr:ABC transporter ATP-binding protein [Lentisphaeria bacterium]MBR2642786.1 ABC transporter ATP-binding protein [Lentisphaeria bacterium]
MNPNVLEIKNLRVSFFTDEGETRAVNDVCFEIPRGKFLALVGESGCGKSVTSYSILRLIQHPGKITGGQILLHNEDGSTVDIASLSEKDDKLYEIRGDKISMIFQEPMTALSPVHTVGNQLCEVLYLHRKISKQEAEKQVISMLGRVGIPAPERRFRQYPFELSGGMRQRVVIAMAMLSRPELLIADEPTTALDVTIQAQVLALMKSLQEETGNSVLLITHDLAVVAQVADLVAVMYLGRIVERGNVVDIIKDPLHPYTFGLLRSLPGMSKNKDRLPSIPGSVPSLLDIPPGCPFHPRCDFAQKGLCDCGEPPPETDMGNGRMICCYRAAGIRQLLEEKRRMEDA